MYGKGKEVVIEGKVERGWEDPVAKYWLYCSTPQHTYMRGFYQYRKTVSACRAIFRSGELDMLVAAGTTIKLFTCVRLGFCNEMVGLIIIS